MKRHVKPIVVLASGAILLSSLLCQTAQAALVFVNESGTSYLADVLGSGPTSPESLTVSWSVVENSGIYTYTYTVHNPMGDVLLNNNGQPTLTPEIVDYFSLGFNAAAPGAYLAGSLSGGSYSYDNGANGVFWGFMAVNPNFSSPTLSFQSDLPPTLGDAEASDANPPSPWTGQLPVPSVVATAVVPESATLLAGMLLLLPFRSTILQLIRKKETPSLSR